MNAVIIIRKEKSRYQVFEGDLLLASFGSKDAAEEYATLSQKNKGRAGSDDLRG